MERVRRASPGAASLLLVAALASACTGGPAGQSRSPRPTASHRTGGPVVAPIWFRSVQMVTPSVGWALAWSGYPGSSAPKISLQPVRTTDGGRTWRIVTPPAARPALSASAPPFAWTALFALGAEHALLAVTLGRTTVYATADGGASWDASRPFDGHGTSAEVSFVDPSHGWMLADGGGAAGSEVAAVLRTADGGLRWSLAAWTGYIAPAGTGTGGLPTLCDKSGVAFADRSRGWVTGSCAADFPYFYVTHDGGLHWTASAAVDSLAAPYCRGGGCDASPVASFGPTQIMLLSGYPRSALLLTHDAGASWRLLRLPIRGAGYSVSFPDAGRGFLLEQATQQGPGGLLATGDGGIRWQRVPTDLSRLPGFGRTGSLDFVTPKVGFVWGPGSGISPPPLFVTHDGGRRWVRIAPVLVR